MDEREWTLDADSVSAVDRVVRACRLTPAFQFLVMVTSTPRAARLSLEQLCSELPEFERLAFVPKGDERPDAFAGRVGHDIDLFFTEHQGKPAALDASLGTPEREAHWQFLFQRLNESRDTFARQAGALILLLPVELEGAFARSAPDFWSVRTLVVRVSGGPVDGPTEDMTFGAFHEELPTSSEEWARAIELAAPWLSHAERAAASTVLAQAASPAGAADASVSRALDKLVEQPIPVPTDIADARIVAKVQVWLNRLAARYKMVSLEPERDFGERTIALWKAQVRTHRDQIEPRRELVMALYWAGEAARLNGREGNRRELLLERIEQGEYLYDRTHQTEDLHQLFVSMAHLAQTELFRGDDVAAFAAAMKSVELAEQLYERTKSRESHAELAAAFAESATAARQLGALDHAAALANRSVSMFRTLDEVASYDLSLALVRLGGILRALGKSELAVETFEEAIGRLRTKSSTPEHKRQLSVTLNHLTRTLLDMRRFRLALDYASESVELMHDAFRESSTTLNTGDLGHAQLTLSEALVACGQIDRARGALDACITSLERLVNARPGPSPWQRDLLRARNLKRLVDSREPARTTKKKRKR